MWSVSKHANLIFIISWYTLCYATNPPKNTVLIEESPLKMYLVEDIVRKVCNISLNTFSNKSPEEKSSLLLMIEDKLNKSARSLGVHGTKYVSLIMKGVKAKALENDLTAIDKQAVDNKQAPDTKRVSGKNDVGEMKIMRTDNSHPQSKSDLVQNIAEKIEILARGYLANAKTEKERQKAVEEIKKVFLKTADRKRAILHTKHDDMKIYVDLVAKGIELVMKRDVLNRRRMEFVYTENINLNKESLDHISDLIDPVKPDSLRNNEIGRGASLSASKPKTVFLRMDKITNLDPKSSCDSTIAEACQKIQSLKTLRCLSDDREFNILKLCDGEGDCLDSSDENQCGRQAIETIQAANRLISYIDTSINAHHCFPDIMDKNVLSKQHKLLSDVLKNQIKFLEKHSIRESESFSRRVYNTEKSVIMETVQEAVNVVDSLMSVLGMSICPDFHKDTQMLDSEYIQEEIRLASQNKTVQENCKCNGQKCLQKCSPRCENICFQMYSLSQLSCNAVSGEELVSLDMVCDGKLDCFDEIDEMDCSEDVSLAKFEATHMYDYVLKEIQLKTAQMTYETVRSRLQTLHALVTKLEKLSLKRHPEILDVKRARQACFEELSKVYDSSLIPMKNNLNELFNLRFFLVTLNERLISAIKRSNTGNDKIISSDGCVCRGNQCALPRCSKSCIRACLAEPRLTRFFCGEPSEHLNNSLPIELVCNGKLNCPNGEDEKGCKKDVCRTHHIIVLRHKLQDVGKQFAGTTLGEALRSWRVKVLATLMIAENNERPSRIILHDMLRQILRDLVMTFAALEDRRDSTAFDEVYSLSRVVIDTLKSCNQ